jgi:hypothetical protein
MLRRTAAALPSNTPRSTRHDMLNHELAWGKPMHCHAKGDCRLRTSR